METIEYYKSYGINKIKFLKLSRSQKKKFNNPDSPTDEYFEKLNLIIENLMEKDAIDENLDCNSSFYQRGIKKTKKENKVLIRKKENDDEIDWDFSVMQYQKMKNISRKNTEEKWKF